MGIDYGVKRIGIAISDEQGKLAFPKKIILNDSNAFKKLDEIFESHNVDEIVVGESTNFTGQANTLMARIEVFIKELEKRFNVPTHKQKEFLTSVEARRSKKRKKDTTLSGAHSHLEKEKSGQVDASAAALILQRYLDKINNRKL